MGNYSQNKPALWWYVSHIEPSKAASSIASLPPAFTPSYTKTQVQIMRYSPIIPALALFTLAGCGSGSSVGDIVEEQLEEQVTETISGEIEGAQDSLLLRFSGATFVAVGVDDVNVEAPSGIGSVSFTNDTVTWTRTEIVLADSFVQSQTLSLIHI